MARFFGTLGLRQPLTEISPGIFEEEITTIEISGHLLRQNLQSPSNERLQSKGVVSHRVRFKIPEDSISNYPNIAWITWMGKKWTVSSVEYQHPNIIASLGSIYNAGP